MEGTDGGHMGTLLYVSAQFFCNLISGIQKKTYKIFKSVHILVWK